MGTILVFRVLEAGGIFWSVCALFLRDLTVYCVLLGCSGNVPLPARALPAFKGASRCCRWGQGLSYLLGMPQGSLHPHQLQTLATELFFTLRRT